ncbi:MAG: tetratricopeptide repeat protein [Isosphaeraceae bacterium]
MKAEADRSYVALVRGTSQRLAGKVDQARATLLEALAANRVGVWSAKIRLELAGIELAAGRHAEAEALARSQAETLLAGDRKDRLAQVYYTFAKRLLKPDDPVTPADPNGAYALLEQARSLAKGASLRGELLFAMGKASQQAGNPGRAIQDFQNYLKDYPRGTNAAESRYRLGEAQRVAGQTLAARLTWSDLVRDLDGKAATPDAVESRARAMYGIALTYGIPAPPNDTSLNLGVTALRRFIAAYPSHTLAVTAAYQLGESYRNRGKSEDALAAFHAFLKGEGFKAETDEARRNASELTMTAAYTVALVLQGQQKFDEAIAAWKGYLAKYPNGPQSADAQRAILDTQLLIADDHLKHERYDQARTAWLAFVSQNPLDARVPQVLYQVGESFVTQKKFDEAVAAWDPLISKFPGSEPAAHARFSIASIHETEKGDPETAIEEFRKISVEPWRSQAAQRVAVMEGKALTVVTPRTFRSGETPHLKVSTRNLEKLTFSAYKLNAESYFRKKHGLSNVEGLDIGLVAPDAEWTVDVPGYARYKPIEMTYDLAKLAVPGVYVVKVTDEKHLQATSLVVGSDVDAIIKSSRDQLLVFVQDMKSGKGRPDARVLVAQGDEVVVEAKTGPDGVLLHGWEKPRDPNAGLTYLVLDGANVAGTGLGVPGTVAQGLSPKAYLYTDRPAYRPGQQVALRGVVREVKDGQYANTPGSTYRLEVSDSRGRQIVARPVTLSDFGTFHESLPLDEGAPVGTYRVRLYQPGKSEFAGQFEVQAYRLESIDLRIDLKSAVVFRGETVEADVVAGYQYGAPAANRPISVRLPDGRILHGSTDAAGKYHVQFSTEGFAEEQMLSITAQLTQDNVAVAAAVSLAVRAFSIGVNTSRSVYLDGEPFQVTVNTTDARGEPTGQNLTIALVKRVTQAGQTTEREVGRQPLVTDPKTGVGRISLKADDADGGTFIVRASGTDRFGNAVVTDRELTISGAKDETRLRLLAERQTFKVGEDASLNLHSRGASGTALLTWEADRIFQYRIVDVKEGNNAVAWAVEGPQFPNFTLSAARMSGDRFDQASIDFRVERDLRVTLTPATGVVGPGDEVQVDVTTTDQLGRPVAAEVAVALVDRSLLRLYGDRLPPIGGFFYDQTRTGAFSTVSTNTFSYHPGTTPVAEAVVEDAERSVAQAANAAERGRVMEEAKSQLADKLLAGNMPAPASAPAPAPAPMDPQAPGGMGGMPGQSGQAPQALYRNRASAAAKGEDLQEQLDLRRPSAGDRDAVALGVEGAFKKKDEGFWAYDQADPNQAVVGKRGGVELRLGRSVRGRSTGGQEAPRQRYSETAYWNPSVVTKADGKARFTFKAPTSLSSYQFMARGATGADTLVGQTTAGITVRKDFFVELKLPAELTQGDAPRFAARLHHVGVKGNVSLKLSIYAGGRDQVQPKTVELKADGVDEVLFDPFEVPEGENVRLTLTAESQGAKDELVAEVPVRPWGVQATATASGTSSNDATVYVGLPRTLV